MTKKLTEIFNKVSKKPITEKKVREPSAYNIYMREQMEVLKDLQKDMSKEEKPSAKDNMKKIAQMWKEKKEEES